MQICIKQQPHKIYKSPSRSKHQAHAVFGVFVHAAPSHSAQCSLFWFAKSDAILLFSIVACFFSFCFVLVRWPSLAFVGNVLSVC